MIETLFCMYYVTVTLLIWHCMQEKWNKDIATIQIYHYTCGAATPWRSPSTAKFFDSNDYIGAELSVRQGAELSVRQLKVFVRFIIVAGNQLLILLKLIYLAKNDSDDD